MLAQLVVPDRRRARSWAALCMDCTRDAVYAQLQTEADWAARTRRRINEFVNGATAPSPGWVGIP